MLKTKIVLLVGLVLLLLWTQGAAKTGQGLEPPTQIQDQIIQNKGNIATTIQNWGWIGGQSYLGKPSGEWPKGSGHDYLAEIKYWMGATTTGGDTIVADTDEDLAPLASIIRGQESYRIRLSTDTTSYDYDPSDTVGLGIGKPAYGWRVWSAQDEQWEYNRVWTLASGMVEAGPVSLQESHYRFCDGNSGAPALGLELTQSVYQWNYSYNQDYLFVVLEIKNVSGTDYADFAFGLYCDFDVGGLVPGTFENGRLGDLVAFDSSMNLAWTYDEDGYDEGWGALVKTGVMGTKYIETPDNIGMTAFRTGRWEDLPEDDAGKYEFIDSRQFDQSLPPTDQYYIQCTRGINLSAGKAVRVVFALVAGYDERDLKENAAMAQAVYDNHFIGPEPPQPAKLVVNPGYQQVKLTWDNASESSSDPLSGKNDFAGYKIYRSTDMGQTWGDLVRNPDGSLGPDYVPIAKFQKEDSHDILPHTYTDQNLVNGIRYWYSVVSFDQGDTSVPIDPLQTAYGRPGEDQNCALAYPRTDPAGYVPASATVVHSYLGQEEESDGWVVPTVFDQSGVTGHQYKVVFADDPYATYWHMIDMATGDTVLKDQTDQSGNTESYPVVDGMQVVVTNGQREPAGYGQTQFGVSTETTLHMQYFLGSMSELFGFPLGGDVHFRCNYELRFTQAGSQAYSFFDDVTPVWVPFEVWNTTTGQQVLVEVYDQAENGVWDVNHLDYLDIVDVPYDGQPHPEAFPYWHSWFFAFAPTDVDYSAGDVYQIKGAQLNGPDDEFVFGVGGVDPGKAKDELSGIKVVPNPYIAHALWETSEGIRNLQFTHLPDECTIRIYTLAGDLVRVIRHDNGTGTENWDLLNKNQQGVVPGVYFYHVESKYGQKLGKFAVIK
jgi:hypothetical protein